MKKSACLTIFLLALSLLVINTIIIVIGDSVTGEIVTGESITGEAASQSVSMNISVTSINVPSLIIISPENQTYLTNHSLLLNYSVSDEDAVWYNLDNTANTTITSFIYFNTSQGSHILYLYANNTNGVTAKNVSFVANSTLFTILYEENKGSKKGKSTNFMTYSYGSMQNLSNIILENTNSGKILFNQAINLTDDSIPDDNLLDLDSNTNVSFNRIELNATALPNFNVTATLWLYNLTFPNPRILKDGEVCPTTICTEESYLGGTLKALKFNVTSFSVYSAEETPGAEVPEEPSAPSEAGGGAIEKVEFEVEPKLTKVTIKKGEIFKSYLTVTNTKTSLQKFNIEVVALEDFLIIPEPEFSLGPGEEKKVLLIFSSPEDIKEDTYTGKIKISTLTQEKEVPVILGIESRVVLFDVTLNIPLEYKEMQPGEEVLFQLSLFNLGGIENADTEMTYHIKDFEGKILVEKQEVMAVETQASFSRSMKVPPDITDGQYIVIANVRYVSSVGTASDIFYVGKVELAKVNKILLTAMILGALIIILITILIILYFKRKIKKTSKEYKKELNRMGERIKKGHLKLAEAAKMGEKLRRQLYLLEKAYKKGYITKQSYEIGKSKIKKIHKSLKEKYL